MNECVAAALEEAFPDRELAGIGSTGPSWNEANRTVEVAFADGESVYLKVAVDGDGSRIARERAALASVGANGDVPVPTVAASDPDADGPYLATEPVSGRPLLEARADASEGARTTIVRRFGAALAAVHGRRFETHGRVVGGDADGLDLRPDAWTDVLVDTIEDTRDRADPQRFDDHFDDVIAAVEANRDRLDGAPAALLHGDPARPNCFLREGADGDRVGLLDWELVHVGDPARDLYRARDQWFGSLRDDGPDRLATALRAGYRDRAGALPTGYADRRPIYRAVRTLGRSGFVEEWARLVDESAADVAARIDEELERRLDAIR